MVFLAISADNTSFVPEVNVTIEGNTQKILRHVPATNVTTIVDSNSSFSFASSTLSAFSQEDKLFHLIDSNSTNRWDLYPVNLLTNARGTNITFTLDAFPSLCLAMVGPDLIYRDSGSSTWKKVSDLGSSITPTATVIGPASGTNRCTFNLASVNGRLFDAEFTDASGSTPDTFVIRERSTATGAVIATLGSFAQNSNPQDYGNYLFAFDRGFFYLVRRVISTGLIEIFRFDYSSPANPMVQRGTITPSTAITGPVRMDVHNGFIAMIAYTGITPPIGSVRLFTFDDNTLASTEKLLGNGFYDVQVLNLP